MPVRKPSAPAPHSAGKLLIVMGGTEIAVDASGVSLAGGADAAALAAKVQAALAGLDADTLQALQAITPAGGGPAAVAAFAANQPARIADRTAIPAAKVRIT